VDFFCDARVICGQHELHLDIRAVQDHLANEPKGNNIAGEAGVFHGAERLPNGVLIDE
jgi:hypothetical protein